MSDVRLRGYAWTVLRAGKPIGLVQCMGKYFAREIHNEFELLPVRHLGCRTRAEAVTWLVEQDAERTALAREAANHA